MLVGIHKDQYGKFCSFLKKYEKILNFNGIDHFRMDSSYSDFWKRVKELDLFIYRYGHYDYDKQIAESILPVIESMGIKCFPDRNTYWHFDDKIKQYYLLKQHGYQIIESNIFWDKKEAQLEKDIEAQREKLPHVKTHAVSLPNEDLDNWDDDI